MAKVTGGCLCGAVRFEYDGPLAPAGYCHCEDCRRMTGSAFNVSVGCEKQGFTLLGGELKHYTKTADSGHELSRHFCAECGSPLYTSSPKHPDVIYVKAGSFDDPRVVEPGTQAWLDSSVQWARIPDDLPGFARGKR